MAIKMFVNVPIRTLSESVRFWSALGFAFNPQFTSETTTVPVAESAPCASHPLSLATTVKE